MQYKQLVIFNKDKAFPQELKSLNTFIRWSLITRNGSKPFKSPIDFQGNLVDHQNKEFHMDFNQAIGVLANNDITKIGLAITQLDGIQLTCDGKEGYLHILDLDGFVNDENLLELGKEIVEKCDCSYLEVSPSGIGAKIFLVSDLKPFSKSVFKLGPNEWADEFPDIEKYNSSHGIEWFTKGFFNTITLDVWNAQDTSKLKFIPKEKLLELWDYLDSIALETKGLRPEPLGKFEKSIPVTNVIETFKDSYRKPTIECLEKDILPRIDNQDEQTWTNVANALARLYGEQGRVFFDKYSEGNYNDEPYDDYDPIDVANRYDRALEDLEIHPYGVGAPRLLELSGLAEWEVKFEGEYSLEHTINQLDTLILGDKQNGELFAGVYRGKFLYVWELDKWFKWNDVIWQECFGGEVEVAAKNISALIASKAMDLLKQGDSVKSRKLFIHASKAQNKPQLSAMIDLAKSEADMSESNDNLDKNPSLLGVKNGVVDLKTGHLLFPDPKFLITKQCNANYDSSAKCPNWLKFLNEIFKGNQELINSVQRLLGYSFTGEVSEEIMVICYGFGANGKSVMSNVIQHIAGSYGQTGAPSLLKARKDDDNSARSDIAGLVGARYVSLNEMQSGDKLDEQVVKILAGREATKARFLYGELFTFKPTGKIWLKTNHKPIIKEDDDGIWRRLVVVPFARKFTEEERDLNLEEKLKQEADGILSWIVEGSINWYSSGLEICKDINKERQSYRSESDLLGLFLEEKIEFDNSSKTIETEVYFFYTNWCKRNGNHALSKIRLTQKLKERGITQSKSGVKRFYDGVKLVVEPPSVGFI